MVEASRTMTGRRVSGGFLRKPGEEWPEAEG